MGGDLFRGGVHGGGALVRRRDERGGGVDRGFGLVPVHSVFLLPSCDMRYFQYASSREKYTHVVSRPSLAAPDDEADVLREVFLVVLYYFPALAFVVAPRCEKLSGNLVVLVTKNFSNEGELSLGDLISDRGNVEESCAY